MSSISEWLIEWSAQDGEPGWDVYYNNRIVEYGVVDIDEAMDLVRMRSGFGQPVMVIDAEYNEETMIS